MRIFRFALLFLIWLVPGVIATISFAPVASASVVRVETTLDGDKLNLVEIEVTSGNSSSLPNRTVPYDRLVPTSIVDFVSVNESNAANTVTVLGTPEATAPTGDARLRLLGDPHLNTGVFNPSYGTPGIHVAFDSPVRNGPGVDVVLFELTIGSGQTPDPIEVLLPGGIGTIFNAASGDYQLQGVIPAGATPRTFQATVNPNSSVDYATLRDAPLALNGAVTNPKWHAIAIDLDMLGVAVWGTISELHILSDNMARNTPVDLLMVVGLPPAIWPGDYDGDLDVDGRDFLEWQRAFGTSGSGLHADGNGDGHVDAADYTIWSNHYGNGVTQIALFAVPEPTALWLAVTPILVFFVGRKLV